jgi:peptide-methionine (S)-S-oxide reductase
MLPAFRRKPAGMPAMHDVDEAMNDTTSQGAGELITLAGGCFWCTEAVFERVRGVLSVQSGYCNGHVSAPSYEQVCAGNTGHAEALRVRFDPAQISLQDLLSIFFAIHDPTTLNRQGADVGRQYRSGIYVHSAEQEAVARAVLAEAQQAWGGRVVTEIQPERNYSPAEDYHQHYFARNPDQGYCAFVVAPKVAKFAHAFKEHLRD